MVDRAYTFKDPQNPGPACKQATVTVPLALFPPTYQKHYWGSRAWYESFNRRNQVEGFFGNLKNEATEDMDRGNIRMMGLTKVSLLVALWAAAPHRALGGPPG